MEEKPVEGRLYKIAWGNPYTEPPAGAPRVLAEVFVIGRSPAPDEFENFPRSLGGGYSCCIGYIRQPSKQLPPETLAIIRKKRLARKVSAKVPMFADFFIDQEMEKKPDYYNGITDERLKQAHDAVLKSEWERYYRLINRPGEVIVYADEPQECKDKSARLKTEMTAIQQRARGENHEPIQYCS